MSKAKSIGTIIAGFIAITILTSVADAALTGIGTFPDKPEEYVSWMLLTALTYRTVFAVVGGFVVGKLAPVNPARHVIVLAAIGTVIGIIGVITGWNTPGYPHWYSIALTLLTYPAIWYGGKLADNRKHS